MKNLWFALLLGAVVASTCFAQEAATVMFSSGAAHIVGLDGKTRPATRGAVLVAGETVDTVDGRAQLRFRDGASMSLQPATRFRVDEFRFADQGGKAGQEDRGFFSLLKGGFRTLTGLIGKERQEQYKVDAVVATIGIRGTDYSANLGDEGLKVATFDGLVEVCNNAGCVRVAPGESVVVPDPNSPPRRVGGGASALPGMPTLPDVPPPRPVSAPDVPVNPPVQSQQQPGYSPGMTHGPYR